MKDNGCWCTLKFHLPGERKRHQKAYESARRLLGLPEGAISFPAPRPGTVTKEFVDNVEKFGASARLVRKLREVQDGRASDR